MSTHTHKTILFSMRGLGNNAIFTINNENDHNVQWKVLKQNLAELGYDIKTTDDNDLNTAERILFFDYPSLGIPCTKSSFRRITKQLLGRSTTTPERAVYQEAINLGLRDRTVLMLWEPGSVVPENYTKETYEKFDTILTWNDDLVDKKKFFKYLHPYPARGEKEVVPYRDKKTLVNISWNKHSSEKHELYSERRASIAFFDHTLPTQFELFGYGWNKPATRIERLFPFLVKKYQSYRGTCSDKLATLSHYKFTLCYENTQHVNGFISEKIFDCFNAKTVPIYWGADNIENYIPKSAFIDRRDFRTNAELLAFLETIDETQYAAYIAAIEAFLQSDAYTAFLPEQFADTVINILKL